MRLYIKLGSEVLGRLAKGAPALAMLGFPLSTRTARRDTGSGCDMITCLKYSTCYATPPECAALHGTALHCTALRLRCTASRNLMKQNTLARLRLRSQRNNAPSCEQDRRVVFPQVASQVTIPISLPSHLATHQACFFYLSLFVVL